MHTRTAGHMPRMILTFLAIATTGTFVAGCGDDEETASKDATAPAPASFAIKATAEGKKKALTFPATVKAGVVTMTLKNSDTVSRSPGIVRLLDGHTVEEFRKTVAERGAPIPDWIEDGGGLPGVEPGATATVTQVLAPGRYGISDDETEGGQGEGTTYAELGAEGEFTVTGAASDVELPAQPATLTATDDGAKEYGFEFEGLKAGPNKVRFENTGKELHHAIMFPINKGKTIEDAEKAFASDGPPKGPPPVDFERSSARRRSTAGSRRTSSSTSKPAATPSSASSKIARAVSRTSPRG